MCAVFNPQVQPTQDPNWLNQSKPISDIPVDKSKAIAITTAAQGIETGAEVGEGIDRDIIKDKVRAGVDTLRDTTTLAYQNIRDAQMKGQTPSEAAMRTAGFTGSLLGGVGAGAEVPAGLQAGIDRAGDIGTALAQGAGTKANDTLYTNALNVLAKQLRSEYPGHRDFIDEQISRISGKNPANAYMDNLLQDINRNAIAANSELNKTMALARQNIDMPGIIPYMQALKMNLPNAEDNLMKFLNQNLSKKYQFDEWERQRKARTDWRADDADLAKEQFQQEIAASSYRHFNGLLAIPGLTDPATIRRMVTDSQNGVLSLTPEQHNQLLSAAVAARSGMADEAKRIANDRGYSSRIRDPEAEKGIINNEMQFYDRLIDNIKNKEYGSLFEARRNVEAMQDQDKRQLLTAPGGLGAYMRLQGAVVAIGGPNWANFLDSVGLQKGYLGQLQSFVNETTKRAVTPGDLRNDGTVKSMYDDIAKMQQAAREGNKIPPRAYDDVVHNVDLITDSKTPIAAKREVVNYAFDEKNWKLMDAFKKDFTDSQGRFHKGKYSVFDTMTQPGITDNIWNLKDSQAWSKYKNWADTSFKTLYGEELNSLSGIGEYKGMPIRVLWDADNNRFSVDDGNGGKLKANTAVDANYINYVEGVTNRLNSGLYNLSKVHAKDGGNTSEFMLNKMIEMGFKPNETTGGLPQQMMNAIISSKKKKDLSEAFEKANK